MSCPGELSMTVKSSGLPTCSVSNSVTPGITGSTTTAEDKSCVSTSVMQGKQTT